jgi:hypothetical protein
VIQDHLRELLVTFGLGICFTAALHRAFEHVARTGTFSSDGLCLLRRFNDFKLCSKPSLVESRKGNLLVSDLISPWPSSDNSGPSSFAGADGAPEQVFGLKKQLGQFDSHT